MCSRVALQKNTAFWRKLYQAATYSPKNDLLWEGIGGCLILLLVLQFPFFLGIEFGFLAFFLGAFVFTASVAHIRFSLFEKTALQIVPMSG